LVSYIWPIYDGSIFMGNDHALEIVGIGTIKLKIYNGLIRTISEMWHVKGLKNKILFMGQFDNLGCKIWWDNGIMKIIKRALMVLKARKIAANLFVIMREIYHEVEASIVSASPLEEKMMMWHQKLGHMSEKGLKILSNQKLLHGLTNVTLPFCEHCVISKQHKLTFGTSTSKEQIHLRLDLFWQALYPCEEQDTLYHL